MEEGQGKVRRRQRRRFTDEYKAPTVKLVLSGHKTAGQVAVALGVRDRERRYRETLRSET
jgi:transposase-like protein